MSTFHNVATVIDAINNPEAVAGKAIANKLGGELVPGRTMGSISKFGSKAIYYFPVIASANISTSNMGMVAQSLEGSYMSFVKACFAMIPAKSIKGDIVNVEEYLEMFHQNIGLQTKGDLTINLREDCEEYKLLPNGILNEVNSGNIDFVLNEAYKVEYPNRELRELKTKVTDSHGDYESTSNTYLNPGDTVVTDISRTRGKDGKIITTETDRVLSAPKPVINMTRVEQETMSQNAMRPSVVEVDVTFLLEKQPIHVKIPVGVKTQLHPVDPIDLNNYLVSKMAPGRGNKLFNLIRWQTGELRSLSDILFGISEIKSNVKNADKSDVAKWVSILDKRKEVSKMRKNLPWLTKQAFLPNTSIALSIEDVDEIQRLSNWNVLKDMRKTNKFMADHMLLSMVVVDETAEICYVAYDSSQRFEALPFSTIVRENKKNNDLVNALIRTALSK